MAAVSSVKVAVRARPLNKREIENGSKLILSIEGQTVKIVNKKLKNELSLDSHKIKNPFYMKQFKFDYSYWSVSEKDPHFANEEQIYTDLGADVVKSAFIGYNACIFAYGQTGAGKTHTMMGNNKKPGLIPRICENLFTKFGGNNDTSYRVEISYMEIYNEQVRDLLRRNQPTSKKQENLKVREHPKEGPFVQGVTVHPVTDFSQLEHLMDVGNAVRVTASTMMNNTSSRSHAIFTIKFTQAKFSENVPSETVSKINLVDLAGSERASASGATGMRLKEGGSINKSLTTLGTVISALAENSLAASNPKASTKKTFFVPYRDSVLTWLLKDSIGGNSKTIMIAAVSPAEINYGETLSTLRYASRAMNIVNKPVINEDPNVKLIRELKAEIERLRGLLQEDSQKNNLNRSFSEAIEAKMAEDQDKAEQLFQSWKNKWEQTQAICQEEQMILRKQGRQTLLISEKPHFVGVDVDPLSAEIVIYRLEEGITTIGSEDLTEEQGIALNGSGIEREHCRIEVSKGGEFVYIKPVSSKCYVNNKHVEDERKLRQGDIVQFGDCLRFKFNNPKEAALLIEKRRSGNFSAELPVEFRRDRSLDSGLSCPEDLDVCESPDFSRQYDDKTFYMASCPDLRVEQQNTQATEQEPKQLHTPLSQQNVNTVPLRRNWLTVPDQGKRYSTPINFPSEQLEHDSSPIAEPIRRRKSLCDLESGPPHKPVDRSYSFNKKDFDEKREYVRDLMQKYRKKEVNRIENDRRFKRIYDDDLTKLKKRREQLEQAKKSQEDKIFNIQEDLDKCKEKLKVEKERKRREVEKHVDNIMDSLKKKAPRTVEADKELRKKKFQLRSKVEEFYKRMDLYENCLLGIESDRRRHTVLNTSTNEDMGIFQGGRKRSETVPVQSKDINTLMEQKKILEELLRRHSEALNLNENKIERIKTKFEECKEKYASRLAHSHSLLKELQEHRELTSEMLENENMSEDFMAKDKSQVVHTLRYTNSVSSPLHIERDEPKIGDTIFEYPEDTFEQDVVNEPTEEFVLRHTVSDHPVSKSFEHLMLKKTLSKSEKLEERKGKYENLIKEAERSIVELKSARTLEIDHYNSEAIEADKFCSKIKQRIENDETRLKSVEEELNARSMNIADFSAAGMARATTNSVENQKLQLLQSRNKVIDLFESSLQSTLKDATVEIRALHRSSWSGFGISKSRDYVSTKDLITSVIESVRTENLDAIAEKEAELATYRKEYHDSDMQLKELEEKEAGLQNDVFQQLESRKLRSEMSRVRHYEKISHSVEQLLTITEGEDPKNLNQLTKETQFLGKCRERLEDLEKCMITKVKESKQIDAQMKDAHERLKSVSSELDDYDDAIDCRIEIEIEELESKKETCQRDIDNLNKRLEDERIQYLDILKCQDDFVIIGKEYREARQIMMKVLGNQAAADVQKEVFWASNAIDLIEQGINPAGSPMAGGWRPFTTEKDVQILKKASPRSGIQSFIGRGIIKTPPHLVWESVRNPLSRFIYDNLLKKINVIEHIDDNLKVVYMRHEGRVCVMRHSRDFCMIHCERNQGDMLIAASQSVEHPDCPEMPNVVRAKLFPSGWAVEPYNEDGNEWSLVWYIVKVDIEGSLPSALLNYLCKRLPLSISYLRSYLVYN